MKEAFCYHAVTRIFALEAIFYAMFFQMKKTNPFITTPLCIKYTVRSKHEIIHSSEKPFRCTQCDNTFEDEKDVKQIEIRICDQALNAASALCLIFNNNLFVR